MALEIPNAVAAAGTVQFTVALPAYNLRANNGILEKTEADFGGGVGYAAAMQLQNPVPQDEGCILVNTTITLSAIVGYITALSNGNAAVDALPLHSFLFWCANGIPFPANAFASFSILKLQPGPVPDSTV